MRGKNKPQAVMHVRAKIFAGLILLGAVISGALAGADCDQIVAAAATLAGPQQAPPADPCGGVCIPDCLSCASTLPAAEVIRPPAPVSSLFNESPTIPASEPGHTRAVDHPPLTRT
jgi:hypothetical protein